MSADGMAVADEMQALRAEVDELKQQVAALLAACH
jgi:polyhydroxyalkanoate synthesis regulator phasin